MPTSIGYDPPPTHTNSATTPQDPNIGDTWTQVISGTLTASNGNSHTYTHTATYMWTQEQLWTLFGAAQTTIVGTTNTTGRATINITPLGYTSAPAAIHVVQTSASPNDAAFPTTLAVTTTTLDYQTWTGATLSILGAFSITQPTNPKTVTTFLTGTTTPQ